jgi:hypothetical protein
MLPPNLRGWVPAGRLAHFSLDAAEEMDLREVRGNGRCTGRPVVVAPQAHPQQRVH